MSALFAVLTCFLLVPIGHAVSGALHDQRGWTLFHLTDVLRDPQLVAGLRNALIIAACTTLVAAAIALPVALVSARCAFRGKGLLNALLLAPLILPPFVGAIGMEAILGNEGSLSA